MSIDPAPTRRLVAIVNPESGSTEDGLKPRLAEAFGREGIQFDVCETTPEKGATELAREAKAGGATEIVACGGDGTVMSVINGIGPNREGERPVTVSILPTGTANLLAAALELPTDFDEAVRIALSGAERDIDLGRRDETLFALGIGVGLTERLVSQASADAKEKIGRWAYLMAMLKELGAAPNGFTMTLDDSEPIDERGVAVVVANSGSFGGGMRFVPDAKIDDGAIDVAILRRFEWGDLFRLALRAAKGTLKQDRALAFYQARHVRIEADPPLEVQIDGEPVEAKTPIVAEVLPRALRVRVPN